MPEHQEGWVPGSTLYAQEFSCFLFPSSPQTITLNKGCCLAVLQREIPGWSWSGFENPPLHWPPLSLPSQTPCWWWLFLKLWLSWFRKAPMALLLHSVLHALLFQAKMVPDQRLCLPELREEQRLINYTHRKDSIFQACDQEPQDSLSVVWWCNFVFAPPGSRIQKKHSLLSRPMPSTDVKGTNMNKWGGRRIPQIWEERIQEIFTSSRLHTLYASMAVPRHLKEQNPRSEWWLILDGAHASEYKISRFTSQGSTQIQTMDQN